MTEKHTKEPWVSYKKALVQSHSVEITMADYERACACVNALAGLSQDAMVKNGWSFKNISKIINTDMVELAQERDRLKALNKPEWIPISPDTMPEPHQPVALLNVDHFENVGGDWTRNIQAAGYLEDAMGEGHLFWSVRGERAICLDGYTHWMPLPGSPT